MHAKLQAWAKVFQKHARAWWYAPALGLLAGADLFLIVIPTDGLLISAVMLAPRRWIYTALMVTVGSSLGTLLLGHILQVHGLPFLLQLSPGLDQSSIWLWTASLMDRWGTWAVFLIALSPFMQHPAVAIAALSGMLLSKLFLVVFAGRIIKYLALAYLGTHAPAILEKIWGVKEELVEVGVDPKKPPQQGPTP